MLNIIIDNLEQICQGPNFFQIIGILNGIRPGVDQNLPLAKLTTPTDHTLHKPR